MPVRERSTSNGGAFQPDEDYDIDGNWHFLTTPSVRGPGAYAVPDPIATVSGVGTSTATALATFTGSSSITTLGTITTLDALTDASLRLSYLGDSIVNQPLPTWPDYLADYHPRFATATAAHAINYGISGERASLMVTNYPVEAHVNRPIRTIDEGWFFLQAGGNDVADGVSAATVYGYLSSLWASARADGYTVVALTVLPRSGWGPSGSQATVNTLNDLILSDPTRYDFCVRAHLVLNNPANAAWFYDTTHPTVLGAQMVAQAVAMVLTTQPWILSPTAAGGIVTAAGANLFLNPSGGAVILPKLTTTQRDAVPSPIAGMVIYNTTTNKLNVYTTAWEAVTSA